MQEDAEQALRVIANPIDWIWTPNNKGGGRWNGHVGQTKYRINSPRQPDNVDTPLIDRSWRLSVQAWESGDYYTAPVPTAERAKELCLHHTLTGDISDIRRLDEAGRVEEETYKALDTSILPWLMDLLRTYRPPRLDWHDAPLQDRGSCAAGPRGTYTARFDAEQRWVVTVTRPDQVIEEHRFLTYSFLRLACDLHAHTGEWHVTLPE